MIFIYNCIYVLGFVLYLPILFFKKKWHSQFMIRMGLQALPKEISTKDNIWIHAVSVGEVLVVAPLIEKLVQRYPQHKVVCSVVTKTGYELACQRLKDFATVIYAPLDTTWIAKRYINHIRPSCYIAAETEIWPGLYHVLNQKKVPIVIINGRISERSLKGYQKSMLFLRSAIGHVSVFGMQSSLYSRRIQDLGASESRVQVMGNMKFDALGNLPSYPLSDVGFNTTDKIIVAGSTHSGEEEIVLEMFKRLKTKYSSLKLVLAPRHVERVKEVEGLLATKDLDYLKFSDIKKKTKQVKVEVILIDTIGDLSRLYEMATVVFIGKSLVDGGGQNMLEPVYYACPTLVGPYTSNFQDVVEMLLEEKALLQVQNSEELETMIQKVLTDDEFTQSLKDRTQDVIVRNKGAADKALAIIDSVISKEFVS